MDDIEPVFERLERNLPLRDRTRGGKRTDAEAADAAAAVVTALKATEESAVRVDVSDPDRPVIDLTELTELNEELANAADLSSAPAGSAAEAKVAAMADAPAMGDSAAISVLAPSSAPSDAHDGSRDATTPGRPGRLGRLIVAGTAVVVAARLLRRRR